MKKLQRYRTNNVPAVADPDGCWVADYAVTELENINKEMYAMLEGIAISMECSHGVDTNEIFELLAKVRGDL